MNEYKGVLVYCEVAGKQLAEISREALGWGRKLADELGEELLAAILGSGAADSAAEAIACGAEKACVIDEPVLENYRTEAYVRAMENLINDLMPRIVILGQTSVGRDLSPTLASRLDTTATLDCVELAIDPDSHRMLQTKPVYGGNAMAVFSTECNPQIATIRAKTVEAAEPDASRQGEVVAFGSGIDPGSLRVKVLEQVPELVEGIRLEDAKVVVGGGRGVGGQEGFEQLEELAGICTGTVGATRAACDNEWVPSTKQIGLTGKVISPELYFAIGLSGASQHMAGCYAARTIVAINKDDGANIFREAHYGVVGDWNEVLPGLIGKIRELKNEQAQPLISSSAVEKS
jgi:electron transfer flavoprotein alpha subunit